ncbi:MAG TPA: hypothetical protein VFG10_10105 [Saprospiraceae bacterium]|nr:hypothetical protein [Saprospiraceae bacterium]
MNKKANRLNGQRKLPGSYKLLFRIALVGDRIYSFKANASNIGRKLFGSYKLLLETFLKKKIEIMV